MKFLVMLLGEYGNMIKDSIKNLLFNNEIRILIVGLLFELHCPKPFCSGTGVNKDIIRGQKSCRIIEGSLF